MAELEKLIKAREYCQKLANGIDPISDNAMPSDCVLNQVQLARLFFFLKDYLSSEVKREQKSENKATTKMPFLITRGNLSKVELSTYPISISEFSKRVDSHTLENSRKFSHKWLTDWLLNTGFLIISDDTSAKVPTDAGKEIGITNETRMGQYREYRVTLYNKAAQQFLIDNMDAILAAQGYTILA